MLGGIGSARLCCDANPVPHAYGKLKAGVGNRARIAWDLQDFATAALLSVRPAQNAEKGS